MGATQQGEFASRVVSWQRKHGRHDLPWQKTDDPYRVWLSEVMLQQTQVGTVLTYFDRFLNRFPDLKSLASAELDDVLALWSGLGYYSRARNLHRCAQIICERFGGEWPRSASLLQSLPGIGRSTAAAIASFCFGERVAILDGNVRRVLTRVLGFESDLSRSIHIRELWLLAESMLPTERLPCDMPAYTQGLMDIGATICAVRRPKCPDCPVAGICSANDRGDPESFPVRTRRRARMTEAIWLLWATRDDGAIWLQRRPSPGVWAGLHCLPAYGSWTDLVNATKLMVASSDYQLLPVVAHALTHKELLLHPVRVAGLHGRLTDCEGGGWIQRDRFLDLGLPAPVRKMLLSAE